MSVFWQNVNALCYLVPGERVVSFILILFTWGVKIFLWWKKEKKRRTSFHYILPFFSSNNRNDSSDSWCIKYNIMDFPKNLQVAWFWCLEVTGSYEKIWLNCLLLWSVFNYEALLYYYYHFYLIYETRWKHKLHNK